MSNDAKQITGARLIEELTETAKELFYINGEPDDPEVSDLEATIELVAEAHGVPSEILEKSRKTLAAEREATRREKETDEAVPAEDLEEAATEELENKEEYDERRNSLTAIWELFETAVRLDSQEKRERIFNSAQYISDFRGVEEQFIGISY